MKSWQKIEETVSAWPGVSVHAHRFGGREFCVGSAEVGHVHPGGVVDIPFPRSVAMPFWRKDWRKNTTGCPTQDGLPSRRVASKIWHTHSGSCGCRTSVMC